MWERGVDRGHGISERWVGWWAWWMAAGAHMVLLLGLRVGVDRAPVWMSKQALIWETRPQRLRLSGGLTRGGVLLRGATPSETPVVEALSTEMKRLIGRPEEMVPEGSVVFVEQRVGKVGESAASQRLRRSLRWRCEGEDEEGRRMLGKLTGVEAPVDVSKYSPRGPVILEVVGGRGGELRHVMVKISSGDEAFDAAAVRALWDMQRKRDWTEDRSLVPAIGDELRGQISVSIEPVE